MKTRVVKFLTGENIYYWSRVIIIGVVVGVSVQFVVAWTEPSGTAPSDNVGAPINTGPNSQVKGTVAGTGGIGSMGNIAAVLNITAGGDINAGGNVCNGDGECIGDTTSGGLWTANGSAISNTNTGNVGIGTNSPAGKLHVVSASGAEGIRSINPKGNTHLPFSDGNSYISGTNVILRADGSTGNTERMRVTSGGNVGIRTSAPAYPLDVNGSIRAIGQWLRTTGSTGWYNETFGGGWNMTDTTWIRSYGSKDVYINTMLRADGGFQVDGTVAISADNSTHRIDSPTSFAVLQFDVTGGASNNSLAIVQNTNDQLVFGRYADNFGAFQASPFIFNMDSGKLHVNGGGMQVNSLANCSGKIYTDASGNFLCGADQTGAGSSIGFSGCYNTTAPNDGWAACNSGYAVTAVYVNGVGCGGECVSTTVQCCRLTE